MCRNSYDEINTLQIKQIFVYFFCFCLISPLFSLKGEEVGIFCLFNSVCDILADHPNYTFLKSIKK